MYRIDERKGLPDDNSGDAKGAPWAPQPRLVAQVHVTAPVPFLLKI